MARSIWNGTLTLGLTAVPVKVHSATEDRAIRFHQVHATDGARIKQKRICSVEGTEVPYEEVAKGYPLDDGSHVLLSSEDLVAAAGESSRVIELTEFVAVAEIDPVHFEKGYYLGAGGSRATGDATAGGAYRLLHDALARAGRVGLGRWVFHNREYLVAIRALDRILAMHTMRFADELVAPGSLEIPQPAHAPNKRELATAQMLVTALDAEFEPEQYQDDYRERVLALIASKAAGEEPELPQVPAPKPAPDLMAALEASLAATGGRGRRSRRARTTETAEPAKSGRSGKPRARR